MHNYYVVPGVDLEKVKIEALAKRDSGEDDCIIHFHAHSDECDLRRIHGVYFRDDSIPND